MATRRHQWITAAIITVLSTASTISSAGEPAPDAAASIGAAAVTAAPLNTHAPQPRISGRVNDAVATRIETAFDLAVSQLQEHAECRALFTKIGCDGVEMLTTTLYYPAELKLERDLCRRVEGFTIVGGAPTWLCRRFAKLSDRRAAMLLIHEALHHGGLDERPHDPGAPSSGEINDMVSEACRL